MKALSYDNNSFSCLVFFKPEASSINWLLGLGILEKCILCFISSTVKSLVFSEILFPRGKFKLNGLQSTPVKYYIIILRIFGALYDLKDFTLMNLIKFVESTG